MLPTILTSHTDLLTTVYFAYMQLWLKQWHSTETEEIRKCCTKASIDSWIFYTSGTECYSELSMSEWRWLKMYFHFSWETMGQYSNCSSLPAIFLQYTVENNGTLWCSRLHRPTMPHCYGALFPKLNNSSCSSHAKSQEANFWREA